MALLRLGRVEDGLAQMRLASEISEHGQVGNTSQVLNLAQLYGRLDRPQDALATLGRVDGMSDYGRMVQASVRHTASVRRGDAEAAAEALEFLREHRAKTPEQYLNALLFAEREDEAALAVVELLRSDSERSSTLRWLQDLKQPPVLKGEEPMRERWLRLRERQDVRTEVERWGSMGRIQSMRARSSCLRVPSIARWRVQRGAFNLDKGGGLGTGCPDDASDAGNACP